MRFFFLILSLLLYNINLSAESSTNTLTAEQINLIQTKGSSGIQSAFKESGYLIKNYHEVEAFTTDVIIAQFSEQTTAETIKNITYKLIYSFADLAKSEDVNPAHVVEYAAAGAIHGIFVVGQSLLSNRFDLIKASSAGAASAAIQFGLDSQTNIKELASAVASGASAGSVESANANKINVLKSIENSAAGLISGTITTSKIGYYSISESVQVTAAGFTEGAIESSVKENLGLIPQIKSATYGACFEIIDLEKNQKNKKTLLNNLSLGIAEGAFRAIPGNGKNIRIIIDPVDIDYEDLLNIVEEVISEFTSRPSLIPIIETPYYDDASIRRVSPEL